jgi:release factor glutamine methyltransferase
MVNTIGTARNWAIEELKKAKVKFPELAADLLLGFIAGCDRVRILSHPEVIISGKIREDYKNLIARHASGEPLHYVTGEREFYDLPFRVTPAVLIPRPETELLVEKTIALMKSYPGPARFLDIGTGSGCISIAVAHEVPSATGWAVDISSAALGVARQNAHRHGVAQRIHFLQGDLLESFLPNSFFDFILSNPPYVPLRECDNLPSDVRNYEPHLALFGGTTGLEIYSRVIPKVTAHLAFGGYLLMELGIGQAETVREFAKKAGLFVETILNDLQNIPRCLVARKNLEK